MCPQEAEKHNVLSLKIDVKSIDLQLVSSLLTAINWRNIFANDRHVDDYVTSFMHVFNNAIQQSIFKDPLRNIKPKRILPKHIRQLILKKHCLWKKIHDQNSLANYMAVSREAKSALRNYVSHRKQELLKCHNQSAFNKYINRAICIRALPVKLTDSSGNVVNPGIYTANIFNMEFTGNFSPIDALPVSHDSSI